MSRQTKTKKLGPTVVTAASSKRFKGKWLMCAIVGAGFVSHVQLLACGALLAFAAKRWWMKQRVFVAPSGKVLTLPITNGEDLTHLCDWLLVCMCVYVKSAGLCVICPHTWKWSVCFFFSFPIVFSCLATVFMLWSSPLLMEMAQFSPHIPHLPFLPELPPFCFSLLPLSCSTCFLLAPQILLSPVDALCSWWRAHVCMSKCKWGK